MNTAELNRREALYAQISALCASNQLTEAYILGCDVVGEKAELVKQQLVGIRQLRMRMGYFPTDAFVQRRGLYGVLLRIAERQLGAEFERFCAAFDTRQV